MEFKKIQLNGFKSFAEKTDFIIDNGLTGIVGPNGCGKSNIVESLKWCMGETSAKSMRGSGMEDVIFSGTSNKPSKNIAEVSITLSNLDKGGPLQYNNQDHIEIRRKIEQGCKIIFLSPLFKTYKSKCLGIPRFNLLKISFKKKFVALGGISKKNIQKTKMLNIYGISGIGMYKKKPAYKRPVF